jgi:hypothetical protein
LDETAPGPPEALPPKSRGPLFWALLLGAFLLPLVAIAVLVATYHQAGEKQAFCQQASRATSIAQRLQASAVSDSDASAGLTQILGELGTIGARARSDARLSQEASSLQEQVSAVISDIESQGSLVQGSKADIATLARAYDTGYCPG